MVKQCFQRFQRFEMQHTMHQRYGHFRTNANASSAKMHKLPLYGAAIGEQVNNKMPNAAFTNAHPRKYTKTRTSAVVLCHLLLLLWWLLLLLRFVVVDSFVHHTLIQHCQSARCTHSCNGQLNQPQELGWQQHDGGRSGQRALGEDSVANAVKD